MPPTRPILDFGFRISDLWGSLGWASEFVLVLVLGTLPVFAQEIPTAADQPISQSVDRNGGGDEATAKETEEKEFKVIEYSAKGLDIWSRDGNYHVHINWRAQLRFTSRNFEPSISAASTIRTKRPVAAGRTGSACSGTFLFSVRNECHSDRASSLCHPERTLQPVIPSGGGAQRRRSRGIPRILGAIPKYPPQFVIPTERAWRVSGGICGEEGSAPTPVSIDPSARAQGTLGRDDKVGGVPPFASK